MTCPRPSNFVKKQKFRILGVIVFSSLVITVTLICTSLLHSNYDDSNSVDDNCTEVRSPFTKVLIVQIDNNALWALDLHNSNFMFLIKNWKNRIHSFDYYMGKTVYIGSSTTGEPIRSSSKQYSELSQPSDWVADKIVVDYVDKKVYVLDILASNINVFDLEGKYYNIVLSRFQDSKDIALDPVKRFMFILGSSSIVRANIDGSSRKTIVETTALSSFAIDFENKVYYADLENIYSVNYAGDELQIVSKISSLVFSMAAIENRLFWLYGPSVSQNGFLYSCVIANSICESISKTLFDGKLAEIKAYNFDESHLWNPCRDHGCEHLCIMNSTYSSRCVCSLGWQLDADSKSCKPADGFLLYVEGNHVRSRVLNNLPDTFVEAISPVKLNASFSTECSFDFDVRKRLLIYSDADSMHEMFLVFDGKKINIKSENFSKMTIPAVDWISNNLYYVSRETVLKVTSDGRKLPSQLFSIKTHSMKSLEPHDNDKIIAASKAFTNITSLVVHPNKGLLFYVSTKAPYVFADINKRNLDGSSGGIYIEAMSISKDRNALGIDAEDDQIYWFDMQKFIVHCTNIDAVTVKNIHIKSIGIDNPVTMSIHKRWLYISTLNSIWRIEKMSGQNAMKILSQFHQETQRIYGVKIFSQDTQPIDKSHPCVMNNGDCQRYCFGVPSGSKTLRKICGCNKNEELHSNNRTCYRLV